MVSLKTKNVRARTSFLIVLPLILLNGSIAGLLTDQLIGATDKHTKAVKDETVVAADESQVDEDTAVDQDTIVPTTEEKPVITVYTVKEGDTLSGIASQFGISTNTILWANDLTRSSKIKVGQKLTILPVTGVQYTVKKGDTISTIAKKFDGDVEEILAYNDLEDAGKIKVGMELIIPNAEPIVPAPTKKPAAPTAKPAATTASVSVATDTDDGVSGSPSATLTHPIPGSIQTQGLHGYNGVDFGAPIGTPVYAAAAGTVIVAKNNDKYNGGYGNYVVIEHANGTQTLYAHLDSASVSVGDEVSQKQRIGLSGNTGKSTGPHLHFEVRGGTNPWVKRSVGTHY